jgi:hypothetical protein
MSVCQSIRLVDINKIQQEINANDGDSHDITSNNVASTITEWRIFKQLRWMQNLHQ